MTRPSATVAELLGGADGLLFSPANAGQLAGLLRRIRDDLGVEPPDDLMEFLHQSDGGVADGVMLYGTQAHLFDDVVMPELVEINLQRYDYREDLGGVLLIGEIDDDLIAYHPADNHYWLIDRPSGDFYGEKDDLRTMVASLLRQEESA